MANVIKPKRTTVAGRVPTTANIAVGEIALNMADSILYFRDTNDNIKSVSSGLATVGTAGTYTKVTTDAFGRVTAGTTLISSDLPTYTGTITSSQVTTALGFTPYNSTNPSGYTANTGTVTSVVGGSYLTGGTITTSGTLAVDATSANTASKVVARDSIGNFSAGTITASLSGNATTATTATTATMLGSTTIGSSTLPMYLNAGTATACSTTLGVSITGSSASCTGNSATATTATNLSGGTVSATTGTFSTHLRAIGTGNDYYTGGVELIGNGTTNTVFPNLGFHQPSLYASSLQLRGGGDFRFYAQGAASYANVTAATFYGALSGNAATATALATARTINGVSFDGTANITIADSTKVVANTAITAGTGTKVSYDSKGLVTSSTSLSASDIPSLDASKITSGTIDAARLPSYVDDVIEGATTASFPTTGETGKIYVALDTNKAYRWSGSAYIYITSGAVDSVVGKTGIVTLVKGDVGLGNVDNTSDANKPVSTATSTALGTKIDKVTSTDNAIVRFDGTSGAVQNSSVYINDSGNVGIGTSSPAVKCDVSGQIRASSGILFGTDTASANALDDYEEGTWTPTFRRSGGTWIPGDQTGRYTKIGNRVFIEFMGRITSNFANGTDYIRTGGLPYTPAINGSGVCTTRYVTTGDKISMQWWIASEGYLMLSEPGSGSTAYNYVDSGTDLVMFGSYMV